MEHMHEPPVQFEITSDTRASLLAWLERRGGSVEDFAFPAACIPLTEWVTAIGLMGGGSPRRRRLRGELERCTTSGIF